MLGKYADDNLGINFVYRFQYYFTTLGFKKRQSCL